MASLDGSGAGPGPLGPIADIAGISVDVCVVSEDGGPVGAASDTTPFDGLGSDSSVEPWGVGL